MLAIEPEPGDMINRKFGHNPEESQSSPVGQKCLWCSELLREIKRGIGQDLVEHMIISSGESDVAIACGLGPSKLEQRSEGEEDHFLGPNTNRVSVGNQKLSF